MSEKEVREELLKLYERARVAGMQQAMRDKLIAACTAIEELEKLEARRGTRT